MSLPFFAWPWWTGFLLIVMMFALLAGVAHARAEEILSALKESKPVQDLRITLQTLMDLVLLMIALPRDFGMFGTVYGLVLIFKDADGVKNLLAGGLGTALYTTLFGLAISTLLNVIWSWGISPKVNIAMEKAMVEVDE